MLGHRTTDPAIRTALHAKRLKRAKAHPDTLVIDELGLAHAKSRIDVAVINGCIHGYEIKSERDSLDRLSSQIDVYRQALQKLTLVAAPKHINRIVNQVPDWCGVIVAKEGPRGGIYFKTVRNACANSDVNPVMVAHLLWRNEAVDLLSKIGYAPRDLRVPRELLYKMLCDAVTIRELTEFIRIFMGRRRAWRDRLGHE